MVNNNTQNQKHEGHDAEHHHHENHEMQSMSMPMGSNCTCDPYTGCHCDNCTCHPVDRYRKHIVWVFFGFVVICVCCLIFSLLMSVSLEIKMQEPGKFFKKHDNVLEQTINYNSEDKDCQIFNSTEVRVTSPCLNKSYKSEFELSGAIDSSYIFEATFKAKLLDKTGKEVLIIPAKAPGDPMQGKKLPFKMTVKHNLTKQIATIVIENDNPSGLPENVKRIYLPVQIE